MISRTSIARTLFTAFVIVVILPLLPTILAMRTLRTGALLSMPTIAIAFLLRRLLAFIGLFPRETQQ